MADARIVAKATIPDLSRTIARPRLERPFRSAGLPRVLLITGQAAQGKSILAAQIARLPGPAAVWMQLDAADSDPANLFRLLVHALESLRPDIDAATYLEHPAIALGPRAGPGRIAELSATFLEMVLARSPVRIFIDGIDQLCTDAASLAIVDRIAGAIPSPGGLVLISRELPPLKLASLRIRQELMTVTNDDLAFTAEEIFRFYNELHGMQLAPHQLERIRQTTDGWAGGLVLVWEALRQLPESQRWEVIDRGLPVAMHGQRLAYFSEAIFSRLDETTRQFLIRSAIFDTINPSLIDLCLDGRPAGESQAILTRMVRRNMFIQPFFEERTGWTYRYNQLFRDFLIEKFHIAVAPDMQRRLFIQAADRFWATGNYEGSIRFFLQAAEFEKAAAGIKKIAMGLSAAGRFADLAAWIDRLPQHMVNEDAWLSYYRALGARISGGRKNISAFEQAADRFRTIGDQRGQLLAMASLIETAVFIGHPVADLKRWLDAARTLLEQESHNRYYAFAKTVLWMQVAFGYISGAGDLQQGLSACRNAMLLAVTMHDDTLIVNATVIHVFGLTLGGEFAAAEKALAAIDHRVAAAYPEYRALRNLVHMKLALSKGDLQLAQGLLEANQEEIDRFGLLFLYPIHVDLSGLLQIQQRRFDALGRTARHLMDIATLAANPFYSGLAFRLRALNAYHQDRFERAGAWTRQAIERIVQSLGEESIHLYRCRLIMGMVDYHLNDLPAARMALESASTYFSRVSSHLSLVEARLGLSLVATAMGDDAAAKHYRDAALAMAASKGYDAFSILAPRDIVAACRPALQQSGSDMASFIRRILDRHPLPPPLPALADGEHAHPPPSSGVARRRPSELTIRTLGGFDVHHGDGRVITDSQWCGLRQKLLLKAIVVNGCREIPKDVLMDALWPDSSYEAGLKRFKVTLHRLRRILAPDLDHRARMSCILLKDNLVSLDMARCRVDVNDFLAACDEIRQLKGDDDDQRRLQACQNAVDIYRGDFLPEEPYLSWAEMKRAALRDQYIAVLMEMAAIYDRIGDPAQAAVCCTAVTQADPLDEKAHRQLMRLLLRQGQRSAAIKVYRDLVQTLAAELDTGPDPATQQLYEELTGQ